MRGLVAMAFGFGMIGLTACAEQTDTPTDEPPIEEEMPMEEETPIMDDTTDMTMDDTTMATEEPMEEPVE